MPRRVMLMVKAGPVVDSFIEQLVTYLDKGDIIIDGGNSLFNDSDRRTHELHKKAFCLSAVVFQVVRKAHVSDLL